MPDAEKVAYMKVAKLKFRKGKNLIKVETEITGNLQGLQRDLKKGREREGLERSSKMR